MEKTAEHEISMSDEDRLLDDADTTAKKAVQAAFQSKTKFHRHNLIDIQRALSLNDISRIPANGSPFTFVNSFTAAASGSKVNEPQMMDASNANPQAPMSLAHAPPDAQTNANAQKGASGANANAQSNDTHTNSIKSSAGSSVSGGAIPKSTPLTKEQPATLRDVKQILDLNEEFDGATSHSTPNSKFRPKLSSQGKSNTADDAPKKKKHRGGKKYKEMLAKRAERAKGQNNTTVVENANANKPPQTQSTNANTNNRRQELQDQGATKRGRAQGSTPPDAVQKHKKQMRTHVLYQVHQQQQLDHRQLMLSSNRIWSLRFMIRLRPVSYYQWTR